MKELRYKPRRDKWAMKIDDRPYSWLTGRLQFMPRYIPTNKEFRYKMRQLLRSSEASKLE